MSNETMERILASPKLPSMPMVVMKVLELVDRENVTAKEIASTIQQDPALAAKLLQAANSPFFGVTREIGSIQQAAVVLG
ncbi:MAG: HDOD domain-containing protein, partial [Planctomycetota bacterium]